MKNITRVVMSTALQYLSIAGITNVVMAESLNDWETADRNTGCRGIPYSNLRDRCEDKQEDVEDYCTIPKKSCDDVDPAALRSNIENMKGKVSDLKEENEDLEEKVSDLKKEKEDLEEKKSGLTDDREKQDVEDDIKEVAEKVQDVEDDIKEVAEKVKKLEKEIGDATSKDYNDQNTIRERISFGEKCQDYRIAVWEVFKEAKSKAGSESDPAIKTFAEKKVKEWEGEERGHETAIFNARQALDKCRNML